MATPSLSLGPFLAGEDPTFFFAGVRAATAPSVRRLQAGTGTDQSARARVSSLPRRESSAAVWPHEYGTSRAPGNAPSPPSVNRLATPLTMPGLVRPRAGPPDRKRRRGEVWAGLVAAVVARRAVPGLPVRLAHAR
ncbi:MAG: hypothetical protein LC808_11000 [Actinobacteria bacterium]|nr:hypothetical protein [Actinomycetota bacterium]